MGGAAGENVDDLIIGEKKALCSPRCRRQGLRRLRRRLAEAAVAAEDSPLHGADPTPLTLSGGALHREDGQSEPLNKAVPGTGGRLEV